MKHSLYFKKQDGAWVNRSKGTEQFRLEIKESMVPWKRGIFQLSDVMDHTLCVYDRQGQMWSVDYPDGISCFTYDRQGGTMEKKNVAGIRRFTYNSLHQQTQVETETGKVQKNRMHK